MIKKVLAYFVLLIVLFNSAGYYFAYELNRSMLKHEMWALIRSGALDREITAIRIFDPENNPMFRRIEQSEIEYKDMLYDVVKEEKQGKLLVIYCISDKKEHQLSQDIKGLQGGKKRLNLLNYLVNTALPVLAGITHPPVKHTLKYPDTHQHCSGPPYVPFSPPPENT